MHHNWKEVKDRIRIKCIVCGQERDVKPNIVAKGKGKFCSKRCSKLGKNLPQWKEKIKRVCLNCRIVFEIFPSAVRKGGIFCTKACMQSWMTGENHPMWMGGLSFYPYPATWTNKLKISIKERDAYTCQLCGKTKTDEVLDVHHINYVKADCSEGNLITLCHSCHPKTNRKRPIWQETLSAMRKGAV